MSKEDMTIADVKQEIEDAQNQIGQILSDLQNRTGVVVEDVDIVHLVSADTGRPTAVVVRLVASLSA